jgi:putative transposase
MPFDVESVADLETDMKRSRFSEEQIIGMLKEQEVGAKLAELGRRHGISETTFLRTWRQKVVTPAVKRAAVAHARTSHGISERRARSIIEVDQNPVRCRSRRGDDADLRCRRRELAAEWRRFGYRRLGLLLAREGFVVNRKKLLRLYREEGSEARQSPRRILRTNDGRWTSRAMR